MKIAKTYIIFISVVLALLFASPVWTAWADEDANLRLIRVSGDAEVKVVPDEIILTMGAETSDKDINVAKAQNDEIIKKLSAIAKKYNIDSKQIQTDYLGIEPRYRDNYERRDFVGYFVRRTFVLTLRDISKFEGLLSELLVGGANYVHGIQFRTTELRKYRDQARSLAIKAAQQKANDLAKELGQKVGKPHTIMEDYGGWSSSYGSWWGSSWGRGVSQNIVQEGAYRGGSMPEESTIAPGQISVTARVTVSFELE